MSNKKRAIMVPIMTLAVCAIAMVGLGFAITTSVSTESNTVEKLMVDLSTTDGGNSWTEPTVTNIDKILSPYITTEKEKDGNNYVVNRYLDSNKVYMKIFGNINGGVKLKVDASVADVDETTNNITSLGIKVMSGSTDKGTITLSFSDNTATGSLESTIGCGTYTVQIITVNGIPIKTESGPNQTITTAPTGNLTFTFTAEA